MRRLLKILLIIALLAGAVFFLKGPIVKLSIEYTTSMLVGAPVKIGSVRVDLRKDEAYIRDFRMYNPKGFADEVIMYIPEMQLLYDKNALLKGRIEITYMDAEIDEVVVIKNRGGKFNVDSLKLREEDRTKWQREHFHIEMFELSIDHVVYKDYTAKEKPLIQVYDIKIKDKVYKDVPDMGYFFTVIFQEAMTDAAIKGATIMGVATVASVAGVAGATFWPAGVAVLLVSKDSVTAEFRIAPDELFNAALGTLRERGRITFEDEKSGIIHAGVRGHNVSVKIEKKNNRETRITISARKLLVPTAMYAKVLLYHITEKLGL
jgi:hypothetical protein